MRLRAAYPYFGSKAAVADVIWAALGDVDNYVETFAGSCAVLLARDAPGKIETVNDAHAFLPNFLRAVRDDPDAVAFHAAWPVSEIDMHARHAALLERADEAWVERLRDDAGFFDAEMAGWWVWGASIWIGSGWCDFGHRNSGAQVRPALSGGGYRSDRKRPCVDDRGINTQRVSGARKRPLLSGHPDSDGQGYPKEGVGIFRGRLPHLIGPNNIGKQQIPSLSGSDGSGVGYGRGIFASGRREDLAGYFHALAERLSKVRITCGDWTRVVTPAVTVSHGLTAVFLDPPYGDGAGKRAKLYAKDSTSVAADAARWAIEHGDDPHYRICLAGYESEHEMPATWRCHAWKTNGGYGNQDRENANAARERLWFSPHCLGSDRAPGPLFERLGATP